MESAQDELATHSIEDTERVSEVIHLCRGLGIHSLIAMESEAKAIRSR